MLVAYFESLKYVGHVVPIVLLRFYLGYVWLEGAILQLKGDFLLQPKLAALITENLPGSGAPEWFARFLDHVAVPYWQMFSYAQVYCGFLVGVSFFLGFFVRPVALLGAVLSWSLLYIDGPFLVSLHQLEIVSFLCLAWFGAGRCLGIDYYFFKRQRGWLW